MFFSDLTGRAYPLDRIISIQAHDVGATVQVDGVGDVTIDDTTRNRLNALPARVIPATNGARVLELLSDAYETTLVASPVIAWFADAAGSVVPVTTRGIGDGLPDRDYVVEFADGSIVSPYVGTWPSRAEYLMGMGLAGRIAAAARVMKTVPLTGCSLQFVFEAFPIQTADFRGFR